MAKVSIPSNETAEQRAERLTRMRAYYRANKEKWVKTPEQKTHINAKNSTDTLIRDKRSAYMKRYRAQNPEKIMANKLSWQAANPDKVRAMRIRDARKRYAADPKARHEATKRSMAKKPDKYREDRVVHEHRRRAKKLAAEGSFTAADIDRIFRAQRGRCAYCRVKLTRETISRDHITPLARGGANWARNIQIGCASCNSKKGAKDPIEFARSLGLLL